MTLGANFAGGNGTALEGLKILDTSQLFAGAMPATLMGDFGAEVIKVEHPKYGDNLRSVGAVKDGVPLAWKFHSRNKKCITLDLGSPEGGEIFKRLVKDTDILIEAFRPGTMERWGLGYEDLKAVNPRLIMVRVSGFGQTGPYKSRPGFGTLAEAMSGFAHITGQPDGPPTLPPLALADGIAGLFGLFGAMFAVYYRDVAGAGVGQEIDVSLYEPMSFILGAQPLAYDQTGIIQNRRGNRSGGGGPRNLYLCSDGKWVALSATTQSIARRVMQLVGGDELADDPRYATPAARAQHADEVDALVTEWIRQYPRETVLERFEQAQAAIGPVYNIAEFMEDPQAKSRESIVPVEDPDLGTIRMQNTFPLMSQTPGKIRFTGPTEMGAHNHEIYAERLGMSEDDVQRLKQEGII
ncbi:MAG: CoA transferase [Dehalococcoidia bacterium]|jgi:formyl-CoA transferase|nr:CoA transferase [Dehalococcoidia bacterium]MDP6228799.1 CoA transferase [Dehalococcoidia bacterium]MDP7084434.1 CoA transferase [Dehalococcoidia bacterium]MDP7200037.1 CoA transferase [Dehalococcoidia bacterium]MDP7512069.1 CoA transferase [Dehalococcoidia bacterium]